MQAMSMKRGWLVMVALAAALLAGCSKSSGGDPDGGDTDSDTNVVCDWEVMVPPGDDNQFGGEGIEFLKGCSKDRVYLKLSDQGPVYELDGDAWVETPTQPPSANYAWLHDLACLSDGSTLWVGGNSVFASVMFHYDDGEWSFLEVPDSGILTKIWAVDDDDVYATGLDSTGQGGIGMPLHFDGVSWSKVELPDVDYAVRFADLWASGPGDVHVVGNKVNDGMAVVFHFDGSDWEVTDFTDRGWIFPSSIWGSGPDDVYMAIEPDHPEPPFESIVRWDGTSWDTFQEWGPVEGEEKEFEYVGRIWGTAIDNFYAETTAGIWHFLADSWALEVDRQDEIEPGIAFSFGWLWGPSPDDIYAHGEGGSVFHYTCH